VQRLKALRPDAPLLHLRGRHARGDIAGQLGAAGLPVREQIVYDQKSLPLSDAALACLKGPAPVIVPLFSPRSARLFAGAYPGPVAAVAAISHAVADALPDGFARYVAVAEAPNGEAMLSLLEKLVASAVSG
jgi:uroporphyrinogen-III synthase